MSPPSSPQQGSPLLAGRRCFVVMPFGDKRHPVTGRLIDFDRVYQAFIKPAAEALQLDCIRSDEISKAGLIHREMIDLILTSDVVLVDITTGNPNVMYELGIRHAAKRSGTIILREAGPDAIPFNISGLRAVEYELDSDEHTELSRQLLETNLRNCLVERNVDSLVHTLFPDLNVTRKARPLHDRHTFVWHPPRVPEKKLCIITGDIINIDTVDAWVNPENTMMQLGRYHDSGISSLIRYYGARRDEIGTVKQDLIKEAINRAKGNGGVVEPGTVILTPPGNLAQSNNLALVVHVAAQHGEPARGYSTIRGYEKCVSNSLDAIHEWNESWKTRLGLRRKVRSVLFPLLGTQGRQDPQDVAIDLVRTAKTYFENWPDCSVERVYFLAYTDADQELCLTAFQRLGLQFEGDEPERRDDARSPPTAPGAQATSTPAALPAIPPNQPLTGPQQSMAALPAPPPPPPEA